MQQTVIHITMKQECNNMGFFNFFKKSRWQINKENQERGKEAERQIKAEYELSGKKMQRTGRGHDYKATWYDWITGKNKSEYVEVKSGNAKLSPTQKKR